MYIANDIAITSLETITFYNVLTGNYKFVLDEMQNATIAQTQEKSDITGKQGRKITSLKKNKAVTISGASGLLSAGLMELQTGGEFENKETEIQWRDYLTVNSNAASTTYKAIGTEGNEIAEVIVKNANGAPVSTLIQAAAVDTGKFTYNPSTKAISFKEGEIADGTEILVNYKRKIKADVLENKSDVYSGKSTLYIDALGEDKCGKTYHVQIFVPKADFSGEFSLELGNDQTVHNFEAEALAGACGASDALWTYTVFGTDTNDVA